MILSSIAAMDKTNLMLASHNQHSVERAIETMNQLQMDAAVTTTHPTIHPQVSAELINASAHTVGTSSIHPLSRPAARSCCSQKDRIEWFVRILLAVVIAFGHTGAQLRPFRPAARHVRPSHIYTGASRLQGLQVTHLWHSLIPHSHTAQPSPLEFQGL